MTNNPKKIQFVESCGIKISQRTPSITKANPYNENYLKIKKRGNGTFTLIYEIYDNYRRSIRDFILYY